MAAPTRTIRGTWRNRLATYRDHAVVLRKLDYGEADRIFTLLTRTHGKVGAIAKGVRRPESKLGPSLELYGHIDVLLARGRGDLDVVAQVERVPGTRIAGEMERMSHAALIAELADRVCEDRHPVDGVYELTVTALEELARESDPRRASAYFLMSALELLGYAPQLLVCASCETPLPAKPAAFSPSAGGFLCDRDGLGMPTTSLAAIKVLRLMAAGDLQTFRRLGIDFAGGTEFTVSFANHPTVTQVAFAIALAVMPSVDIRSRAPKKASTP